MTWYEDLRNIEWNGARYGVLDKISEGGHAYLGLVSFQELEAFAEAMNAGTPRPFPADLAWVEETPEGFTPISRETTERLKARKGELAAEAFRKARP